MIIKAIKEIKGYEICVIERDFSEPTFAVIRKVDQTFMWRVELNLMDLLATRSEPGVWELGAPKSRVIIKDGLAHVVNEYVELAFSLDVISAAAKETCPYPRDGRGNILGVDSANSCNSYYRK